MSVAKPILEYINGIKTQAQFLRSGSIFRRFLSHYRRYWYLAAASMGLAVFGAFLFTLEPLYTAQIIDQVVTNGHTEVLYGLIISIVLAVVGLGAVYLTNNYLQGYTAQLIVRDIRSEYYSSLQEKSFNFHDSSTVGDLVSRATMDMQAVEMFVKSWLSTVIMSVFTVVAAFIIMFTINPLMSFIAIAPMPIIFYFTAQLWLKTMPLFRKMMLILGRLGGYIQQNIIGMKIVRIFRREDEMEEGFEQVEDVFVDTAINAGRIQSLYMPLGPAILTLGITMVYLYGGNLIAAPAAILTIGDLTLFTRYMMRLSFPLRDLSMLSGIWINAAAGLERVFGVIDTPVDVKDAPDAMEKTITRGEVEFKDVSFGYVKDRPVLKNLSFRVEPGEKIAILGATGSGKTSLIYLIPRFYDTSSGTITIDGQNTKNFTLPSLRHQVGMVLQDVFIFTGTIRENIAFGRPDATTEQIVEAAKLAKIHDFIDSLPDKYETLLGERGITLSGGQRQRVTIARALLADPKILILDDALSFVDAKTEQDIQEAVEQAMSGRTSFIIAQRLSTIKNADRIMVLDDGKIVALGTHEDLMGTSRVYRRIYETQFLEKGLEQILEVKER